jgi:hypothetical protein
VAKTATSLSLRETIVFMSAAKREAGTGNGAQHPFDLEYEFPQHALLFDDERILRNRT